MTDQQINEAVARKLGWREDSLIGWMPDATTYRKPSDTLCSSDPPDYCHSIAAAWEIFEYLINRSLEVQIWKTQTGDENFIECEHYQCRIAPLTIKDDGILTSYQAKADTAPMAICLAFLKLP